MAMRQLWFACMVFLLAVSVAAHDDHSVGVGTVGVGQATHHFEVVLKTLDDSDIPYAQVFAEFFGVDGHTVEAELHPMLGEFFHYGANVALREQAYEVDLHIDPPAMMRSQSRAGWFESPIDVSFTYDASQELSGMVLIDETVVDEVVIEFLVMPASPHVVIVGAHQTPVSGMWRMWAFLIVGILFGIMATWAFLTEQRR